MILDKERRFREKENTVKALFSLVSEAGLHTYLSHVSRESGYQGLVTRCVIVANDPATRL